MWQRLDTARAYGWLLAAGYGLAFLYGLFAAGNSDINFLSLNGGRQRPALGQRRRRAGHRPLAGAENRPPRPRRPGAPDVRELRLWTAAVAAPAAAAGFYALAELRAAAADGLGFELRIAGTFGPLSGWPS
jgi:hypothetical protein